MNPPPRQLGLVSATALVIASMVGTGVFTTSGFLLADLGSPGLVVLAWAIGGAIAALGALSYGALARRIPESGGEYVFLSRTLHPSAGFLAGWISLLVGFSAPLAAVALAFSEYTNAWLGFMPPKLTASLLVVIFSAIHARGTREGAWVQNLSVSAKLAALVVFLAFAAGRLQFEPTTETTSFVPGTFAVALVWISFSYAGWNAAVYVGGELKNPERTLPRAMLAGTAIVTVLYVLLNAAFVYSTPMEKLTGQLDVARIAAAHLGGAPWAHAISAVIALALATSASALIMSGPRVYMRMAEDGYLPGGLLPQGPTPNRAILLQGTVALAMLWTATYEALLTYIGFTLGLSTAATVAGLIRLRLREGKSLHVPGWPWTPVLFVVIVLLITAFTVVRKPAESALGLATLLAGWIAWWLRYRKR